MLSSAAESSGSDYKAGLQAPYESEARVSSTLDSHPILSPDCDCIDSTRLIAYRFPLHLDVAGQLLQCTRPRGPSSGYKYESGWRFPLNRSRADPVQLHCPDIMKALAFIVVLILHAFGVNCGLVATKGSYERKAPSIMARSPYIPDLGYVTKRGEDTTPCFFNPKLCVAPP